jgi:Spy/CpxP family protein refolding chaperone
MVLALCVTGMPAQILPGGLAGRWWRSPAMAQKLSLTEDQQKKMDEVFQQSRLKLIDLTAALDKEEATLEPLVAAEQPDAAKIRPQIDRVAQARAELEKANANMLLGLRLLLTPEQWKGLPASGGPRPRKVVQYFETPASTSPEPKKVRR